MAYDKPESTPERKKVTGPTMCDWNEHGAACPHRGILSPGNLGHGPWYCREHFYELRGYPDMKAEGLHGIRLTKTPLHSFAVDEIRERIKKKFEAKTAPAVNQAAFTVPIEDEETEAAFAAYMVEGAIPDQPEEPV
jgi:hypothetical protein